MKAKEIKKLYQEYSGECFGLAKRYAPNDHIAKDILEGVFINLKDEVGPVSSEDLKKRVIGASLVTHENSNINISGIILPTVHISHQIEYEELHTYDDLIHALQKLPFYQRVSYNLACIDMCTVADISKVLRIDTDSINKYLNEAREQLRKELRYQ